jgi:hypothetical protein
MKSSLQKILLAVCFCIIPSLAWTYTITDTGDAAYWGGTVQNAGAKTYGDVIGINYFNIDKMDITKSGTDWSVMITGDYFKYHDNISYDSGYPYKLGPGDLYINSNGWNASPGTGHYETDTFNSGEGWNYVVTQAANGSWGLYSLDFDDIEYTNVSSLSGNNFVYRIDQAWKGGRGTFIGTANYTHILNTNSATFTFNTGNLDFSGDVGLHWTMQCGNDVVEGKVSSVPEPTTLLLLGLGLIGITAIRKKFQEN